jgi:hypothetical protein
MNFKVGQKVVCVDDIPIGLPLHGLTKGEIYTISFIWSDLSAVKVVEIKMPIRDFFWSWRFKPIVSQNKGMEIFRKLLQTKDEKELVV